MQEELIRHRNDPRRNEKGWRRGAPGGDSREEPEGAAPAPGRVSSRPLTSGKSERVLVPGPFPPLGSEAASPPRPLSSSVWRTDETCEQGPEKGKPRCPRRAGCARGLHPRSRIEAARNPWAAPAGAPASRPLPSPPRPAPARITPLGAALPFGRLCGRTLTPRACLCVQSVHTQSDHLLALVPGKPVAMVTARHLGPTALILIFQTDSVRVSSQRPWVWEAPR